jgi:aspartate kinase
MRVFKFGGASVKDAQAVKNIVRVLQYENVDSLIIVISAMGKMTNTFEKIVASYFKDKIEIDDTIITIKNFHFNITKKLFIDPNHEIYKHLDKEFKKLNQFLSTNNSRDYDFVYDQIVSLGEILSTKIVSAYLNLIGVKNSWLDARELIKTDDYYRDAKVDWKSTEELIFKNVDTAIISITQGFIGGSNSNTTTLGREGSDFSAAIFGYCLNAIDVTIWKDVKGILNADPDCFEETILLNQVSYKEATEMAFYGASVLHPKTLKPLENKLIPLKIRSFDDLESSGTTVQKGKDIDPKTPCFILKKNQVLVSISAIDFSFMVEHNMSDVFNELHNHKLKVNLIQNSALSFSICLEDKFGTFNSFYDDLKSKYKISYNSSVTLYTIRHFDDTSIAEIENGKKLYLKQSSRETIQIITE